MWIVPGKRMAFMAVSGVWMFSECCCAVLDILNQQMYTDHLQLSKLAANHNCSWVTVPCIELALGCILKFNTHPLLDWDDSQKVGVLSLLSSYYALAQEYIDGIWSPETRALYQLLVIKPPKTTKATPMHFSVESKDDLCLCSVLTEVSLQKWVSVPVPLCVYYLLLCDSQLILQHPVSLSEEINCGNPKTCPKWPAWVVDKNG